MLYFDKKIDISKALYENVCKLSERKDYLSVQDILEQENFEDYKSALVSVIDENYFPFNNRFESLKVLKNNWDGYNGYAPNKEILKKAEGFLKQLPKKYSELLDEDNIYPNPHGTITVEWRDTNKNVISIEFGLNKTSYYSIINNVKDSENTVVSVYPNKLIDALNSIIS